MTDLLFAQCLSSCRLNSLVIATSSFTRQSMKTYHKISAELVLILDRVRACVHLHIGNRKKAVDEYV